MARLVRVRRDPTQYDCGFPQRIFTYNGLIIITLRIKQLLLKVVFVHWYGLVDVAIPLHITMEKKSFSC